MPDDENLVSSRVEGVVGRSGNLSHLNVFFSHKDCKTVICEPMTVEQARDDTYFSEVLSSVNRQFAGFIQRNKFIRTMQRNGVEVEEDCHPSDFTAALFEYEKILKRKD